MTVAGQITDERLAEKLVRWNLRVSSIETEARILRDQVLAAIDAGEITGKGVIGRLERAASRVAEAVNLDAEVFSKRDLTELQHRREAEAGTTDYPPLVELGRVLGFFASVIKSGEPWTETCQREYDAANAALQAVFAASPSSPSFPDGWVLVPREPTNDMYMGWMTATGTWPERYRDMLAAAPKPPSSPASGVRVKALEWVIFEDGQRAITVCGMYAISPQGHKLTLTGMPGNRFGKFDSFDTAKAVAQADYEARIRSALGEHP